MKVASRGLLMVTVPLLLQGTICWWLFAKTNLLLQQNKEQAKNKQLVLASQNLMADLSEKTLEYLYARKHVRELTLDTEIARQLMLKQFASGVKLVEEAVTEDKTQSQNVQQLTDEFNHFYDKVLSERFKRQNEIGRDLTFYLDAMHLIERLNQIALTAQVKLDHDSQLNAETTNQLYLALAALLLSNLSYIGLAIYQNKRAILKPLEQAGQLAVGLSLRQKLTRPAKTHSEFDSLYKAILVADSLISEIWSKEEFLTENTPAMLFVLNGMYQVKQANNTAHKVLAPLNIEDLPVFSLFSDSEGKRLSNLLAKQINGELVSFETTLFLSGNKTIPVRATFAEVKDKDVLIYCVMQDISKQEQAKKFRQEFLDLVTVGMLKPLHSCQSNFAQIKATEPNELLKSEIEFLQENSTKLSNLLESVLRFAEIKPGTVCLISEAYNEAVSLLKGRIETKELTVQLESKTSATAALSSELLLRVLLNYLTNAVKHAPDQSRIIVKVSPTDDPQLIEIAVHDCGPGVAPQLRQKIFEAFDRGDANSQAEAGTGLGLAIVKDILAGAGGMCGVTESKLLNGSCFWVRIPGSI